MVRLTISNKHPILDILQRLYSPNSKKHPIGYILLLFGPLDKKIARGFSQAVLPFDYLTGEDIACIVCDFKRSVIKDNKIEVDSYSSLGNYRKFEYDSHVNYLVTDGISMWSSPTLDSLF